MIYQSSLYFLYRPNTSYIAIDIPAYTLDIPNKSEAAGLMKGGVKVGGSHIITYISYFHSLSE